MADCHLNFHPHCVNKAPTCKKREHYASSALPESKVLDRKNRVPLRPLNDDIKKTYIPLFQQKTNQHTRHHHHNYKSERYIQSNNSGTSKRNLISSIMT